jgi:hypothetical protein
MPSAAVFLSGLYKPLYWRQAAWRRYVTGTVNNSRADADPAGLGQCLQARRNVDAIAKDIVVFDDDVADIVLDLLLAHVLER